MADKTDDQNQEMRNIKVQITGKVQGVWFRAWTKEQAEQLGLDGWVRNRADGSVEAQLYGPQDKVESMLRRLHNGPNRAHVDNLEIEDTPTKPDKGFHKKPTV